MRQFNVLIENNGKFEPYDIMPYLKRCFENLIKRIRDNGEDEYWKYPKTPKEIVEFIKRELKYQYWGRCEYELILSPWPSYTNENGEAILKDGEWKKIDIYEQCKMNMDVITQLFIEEIFMNYEN